MVGAGLPIFATRHPVLILQRPPSWRTNMPVWIDLVDGWYYKPERNTAIMVGSMQNFAEGETADIEGYSTVPDYTEVERYSEATVKRFSRKGNKVVLQPANEKLSPMTYDPADVQIFGKVVTVLRRL